MGFWFKAVAAPGELKFWTHCEAGHGHVSEDRVAVQPHPQDATALICVLADGQGGQVGGAAAAETAVVAALEATLEFPIKSLLRPNTWEKIGQAADAAVAARPEAGYCALVACLVTARVVCGVSCGDSAAVLYQDGDNVLTRRQHKNPPVGSGGAPFTPFEAKLGVGAKVLLVSDGVWRYAGWETLTVRAAEVGGEELIAALRAEVLERNRALPDDFSVVVVEVK